MLRSLARACSFGVAVAALIGSARAAETPAWIWADSTANGSETVYFRKSFHTPPYLWNSRLTVSADDNAEVFLNGVSVAECERWDRPVRMETTVRLNQGENVIAIRARNVSGPAGVLVHLSLGGEKTIVSDASWLVNVAEETGWSSLSFNAAHWQNARAVATHGAAPWGNVLQRAAATPPDALTVAPGFEVELLRSAEPGEGSWINLAFDGDGRLLVASEGDSVPLLRMTLSADAVTRVEPAAESLHYAMGLLWADGGLYANARGPQGSGLYRAEDANGNGRFDDDELRLVAGTRGGGEHGYHAVRKGPDGRIYLLNGNGTQLPEAISRRSPFRNYAEDMLDPELESNELESPAGYILRGNADGTEWELFAAGLRNAYDFDFNADGELFAFDSDMEWDWGAPWYRPTRILHCVSGAEFGWREDRRIWPEEYEDSLPAVVNVGIGSPTGVEFGTRSRFPERFKRALFVMDWSYGRILAVFMSPEGTSYRGAVEPFLSGTPLNVTDLTFGPDGALYFVTGGRGTQSGLYRVAYPGRGGRADEPERAVKGDAQPADFAQARELRRRLGQFHGQQVPGAVEELWPHLGSGDRFIRYAARVALEAQDVGLWRKRALAEMNPTAAFMALMALARSGEAKDQPAILDVLDRFDWNALDSTQRQLKLRVYQLSFARHGRPETSRVAEVLNDLSGQFPTGSWPEDRESSRLLAWLGSSELPAKAVPLIERAPTQEQQLHYIEQLRIVRRGWTPELRGRYFAWWTRPRDGAGHPPELHRWFADVGRTYVDGAWMDKFLGQFREEAVETLNESERRELAGLIEVPFRRARMVPATRSWVREWRMEDLLPHLDSVGSGRDFERGRQAFVDAQCLACHRFGRDGGDAGPELTAAGAKYDRRALLESMLTPSKVINEQYADSVVVLKNGERLTGRVVSQNAGELVIETSALTGDREEVDRDEVSEIRRSEVSSMPEGLLEVLTRDEILDLIAYIESGGRANSGHFRRKNSDETDPVSKKEQAWKQIEPLFEVPEQFRSELGGYRSPLLFEDGSPVRTAEDWQRRRAELLLKWHGLMGEWPPLLDGPRFERISQGHREGFRQDRVSIEVAPGQTTEGWLLVPEGEGQFPAVLVPFYEPETSIGMGGRPGRDFARLLTRRGFVTLSIGTPAGDAWRPERGSVKVQPLSYYAYVAANCWTALANLPEVDAKRIGVVGHSYGGKWALFAGALWGKFAAVAVSDPGIVFDETRPNVNYWEPWYLGFDPEETRPARGVPTAENPRTGAYQRMIESGTDLHELHALIAPRAFFVSGGSEDPPERWVALNHLIAVNRLLGFTRRVGMSNRPTHDPTPESNAQLVAFFEYFLGND